MAIARKPTVTVVAVFLLAVGLTCALVVAFSFSAGPPEWLKTIYDRYSPMAGDTDDTGGPIGFMVTILLLALFLLWLSAALFFGCKLRLSRTNERR